MRVNLSPVTEPSECLSTRIVLPEGGFHPAHCPPEPSSQPSLLFCQECLFLLEDRKKTTQTVSHNQKPPLWQRDLHCRQTGRSFNLPRHPEEFLFGV